MFFELNTNRLRGHDSKLFKRRFNSNIGKFSFSNRVIDVWNRIPVDRGLYWNLVTQYHVLREKLII